MMVSERHEQWQESDLRSESGETEAEDEGTECEGRKLRVVVGRQDLRRWTLSRGGEMKKAEDRP